MKWSDPSKEALPSAWAGNPGNGKETSANQRSSVNLKTWTFFDLITSMDEKHFKHTSPHGCCWDLLIEPLQVIHINFRLFRQHVCKFHARDWYSCNSSSSRREPRLSAEFPDSGSCLRSPTALEWSSAFRSMCSTWDPWAMSWEQGASSW